MSKTVIDVPDGDYCDDCCLIEKLKDDNGYIWRVCKGFDKVLRIKNSIFRDVKVEKCDECIGAEVKNHGKEE